MKAETGREKCLLPFGESTVLGTTLARVRACCPGEILLVTKEEIAQVVGDIPGVRVLINPNPARGLSSSVAVAARACKEKALEDTDGVLFFLADEPCVSEQTVEAVMQAYAHSDKSIVVPVPAGHPVCFGAHWLTELEHLSGDSGGREIIRAHPEAVARVPAQAPSDIDTLQDYERMRNYERTL